MGEIKSSWEIALEKTKNIQADKSILEANNYRTEGKKLVSRFLENTSIELEKELKAFEPNQVQWVKEGMFETLMSHIVLPQDPGAHEKLKHLTTGFKAVLGSNPKIKMIFEQLAGFFKEYTEQKEGLRSAIERQYAPKLEQKRRALSQKLGRDVPLEPESDPEFVQFFRQNMAQFDSQYQDVLDQAKEELKKMLKEN
ncbi:MAG: hypothetical protein JXR70_18290 [Spirochaetales bacterium]|nr:hypothetical protein [Spirochaetales bacterium]